MLMLMLMLCDAIILRGGLMILILSLIVDGMYPSLCKIVDVKVILKT